MSRGNPMRRVIGTDTATDQDRHVNGTSYDVLECGHRVRPDPGRSPAGERRACVNCGSLRRTPPTATLPVRVHDVSPGGAFLKVRWVSEPAVVWWLTRKNASFYGEVRVGDFALLTVSIVDGDPRYDLRPVTA